MKCDYVNFKTDQLHPHTTHYTHTHYTLTQVSCIQDNYVYVWEGRANTSCTYVHSIKAHCISRLTRRDEGVLDCIALDEVAQYAVHTLNDVSIKSLHIDHSTDCQSVLCITLDDVQCTREDSV